MNNGRMFHFGAQLSKGRQGEELLLAHWPCKVWRHEELKGPDFIDAQDRVIELKTDSYSLDATPNFFIERWSSVEDKKPGGPWQAAAKGCNCFVYLYASDRRWFVFESLPHLLAELNALTPDLQPVSIRNRGWTTQGYKIPRAKLAHIYREERLP